MTLTARELAQSVWFLAGQVDDAESIRCVPIHSTPFLIGRRADLALPLPRPTVSSVHAEISSKGGEMILRDLKSTNGTYVNGRRITSETQLADEDLVQFAEVAFRLRRQVAEEQLRTVCENVVDRALALVQFDKLMHDRDVVPFFQPIVEMRGQRPIAYEVLGRSRLLGLESPGAMFRAAARLNLEVELSRMLRWEGIQVGSSMPELEHLFVNTHPVELVKPGLIESLAAVRDVNPSMNLTLEIHEASVTDVESMAALRSQLAEYRIGLAFDDFGAGQSRLRELVEIRPDYVKFDMTLIRGIEQASAQRQQLVGSLVSMTQELGSVALAEGIETEAEHRTCLELGFELAQGYLYGKPAPAHLYSHAR